MLRAPSSPPWRSGRPATIAPASTRSASRTTRVCRVGVVAGDVQHLAGRAGHTQSPQPPHRGLDQGATGAPALELGRALTDRASLAHVDHVDRGSARTGHPARRLDDMARRRRPVHGDEDDARRHRDGGLLAHDRRLAAQVVAREDEREHGEGHHARAQVHRRRRGDVLPELAGDERRDRAAREAHEAVGRGGDLALDHRRGHHRLRQHGVDDPEQRARDHDDRHEPGHGVVQDPAGEQVERDPRRASRRARARARSAARAAVRRTRS